MKIVSLPAKGPKETLVACAVFPHTAHLLVHSGKRYLNMRPADWALFAGNRALRGNKLPRGYQNVAALEVQ